MEGGTAEHVTVQAPSSPVFAMAGTRVSCTSELASSSSDAHDDRWSSDGSEPDTEALRPLQVGDYGGLEPIREDEAACLAGIVPRAEFVALRSLIEDERLLFLRETLALRNEIMRLNDVVSSSNRRAAEASTAGSAAADTGGQMQQQPQQPQRGGITAMGSVSPPVASLSLKSNKPALEGFRASGGGGGAVASMPAPPASGPQLVPLIHQLASGVASASVIADLRALAARQLKQERERHKAKRKRLRDSFARERDKLLRIIAQKEKDRNAMLDGFQQDKLMIMQEALGHVDERMGEQRREIQAARQEAAKHRQQAEACRDEIHRRKDLFDSIEKELFLAKQHDGLAKQERSEMYLALLHMNKEKAAMENRVASLQAQLKHSKEELQWHSLVQSFGVQSSVGNFGEQQSAVFASSGPGGGGGPRSPLVQSLRAPHAPPHRCAGGGGNTTNQAQPMNQSFGLLGVPGVGSQNRRRSSLHQMTAHRPSVAAVLLGNDGMAMIESLNSSGKHRPAECNSKASPPVQNTPKAHKSAIASLIASTM